MDASSTAPRLRHIANLWSLAQYPSAPAPWPLERQIEAVEKAGFDGFTTRATAEHARLADRHGLIIVGYVSSGNAEDFPALLAAQRDAGAVHVNVQLADHDTPTEAAIFLAIRLMEGSRRLGVQAAIEVHRDTCTETPEKTYALADGYQQAIGELLPLTWDCSHFAVVKHLAPPFSERLLVRPDLVQRAAQFHFRPFNGHHAQVPVTDGRGGLTPEVARLAALRGGHVPPLARGQRLDTPEIFAVPEMGPVPSGYNLSSLPNSWEEAAGRYARASPTAWERSARRLIPPPPGAAVP